MKRSIHIQAELNELEASLLGKAPILMPYTIPANYFDTLAVDMVHFIQADDETEVHALWGNSMPFSSPHSSYFEGLSTQILSKVGDEREDSWNRNIPFEVPDAYFDTLPQQILAKVKEKEQKETARPKRVPLFRTVQLAASMALVVFIGLGVLQVNQHRANKNNQLSAIPNSEISAYVLANIDDFDTDLILNSMSSVNIGQELPANISKEEIKNYLEEDGLN
ncbi:MAG: hypothetical protein V4561_08705 [Bacteroidota bacterium]